MENLQEQVGEHLIAFGYDKSISGCNGERFNTYRKKLYEVSFLPNGYLYIVRYNPPEKIPVGVHFTIADVLYKGLCKDFDEFKKIFKSSPVPISTEQANAL